MYFPCTTCSVHYIDIRCFTVRGGGEKHKCAPSGIVRHTLDMRSQGECTFVPVFAMKEVAGTCEYGDEPWGSKNAGNFLTSCKTS